MNYTRSAHHWWSPGTIDQQPSEILKEQADVDTKKER